MVLQNIRVLLNFSSNFSGLTVSNFFAMPSRNLSPFSKAEKVSGLQKISESCCISHKVLLPQIEGYIAAEF